MIKRILNWFGYIPKLDFDIIVKLNADLANQVVKKDKLIAKHEAKIKKLNQNNIRLLKKQGEFKEQIKALEEKLNVYERQSKH
jgi:hypothetical protein|nr:MAG TPA: nuclear pore complex protein [Caudoviricetes sp.]